ncbi:MAG TPA: CHAD domain-containing protein [Cytophagaceae bacterium]|nr:CHAD domain-containing protein [Cytophagaceae bacterium]
MKSPGKYLYGYYQKKSKDFHKTLRALKNSEGKDEIHDLRVSIKKIKALFHFLEITAPKDFKAKKHSRIFKPVFKLAGNLRESQLHSAHMSRQPVSLTNQSLYKKYLTQKEDIFREKFCEQLDKFDQKKFHSLEDKVKLLAMDADEKNTTKRLKKYLRDQTDEIKSIEENPGVHAVHYIRKQIKLLDVLVNILCKISPNHNFEKILKDLHKAEELLGNWHDRNTFSHSISYFLRSKYVPSASERKVFEQLHQKLSLQTKKEIPGILEKVVGLLPT